MTPTRSLCALIAVVLTTACDRLAVAPGQDFGLTLLDGPTVTVVGQVAPVKLRFRVSGCDAFTVALLAGAVTRHQLDFARHVEPGTFEALAPVEWLREEDGSCLDDAEHLHLSLAQLSVTCLDANRTATADFTVAYGSATRALVPDDDLRDTQLYRFSSTAAGASAISVFPSPDPLHPNWTWGPPRIYGWSAPGVVLVQSDSRVVQSVGHLRSASESWLYSWPAGSKATRAYSVLGDVVDLAFGPTGDLMVLSEASEERWISLLPRDDEVPAGGQGQAQVLAHLDGGLLPNRGFSRLPDGGLCFVTQQTRTSAGPDYVGEWVTEIASTTLYRIGADAGIEDVPVELPAQLRWVSASGPNPGWWLALHGSTALVSGADGMTLMGPFLGGPDGGWTPLNRSAICCDLGTHGAAWLDEAVAVWVGKPDGPGPVGLFGPNSDRGWVDVFENAPGHARRFTYEVRAQPGFPGFVNLRDVLAMGDHLVLTTNSGVRILDRDGGVVGGSDPLPCGLSPTSVAAQVGPRTVGIGAGHYLYLFEF